MGVQQVVPLHTSPFEHLHLSVPPHPSSMAPQRPGGHVEIGVQHVVPVHTSPIGHLHLIVPPHPSSI